MINKFTDIFNRERNSIPTSKFPDVLLVVY